MTQSSEDLQQIAARTLAHYEQNAQSFWEGTRDHDVSQNIAALLRHIAVPAP
ncbi:MAG: SAM-dependent methyltransferase, partial [Comamonas sp.]